MALAGALLALALGLSPLAELERSFGLRFLYGLRGPVAAPQDIVIVAMDAASAQALGVPERPERWPRGLHARLISGLAASGARVIGFDVLFAQAREPAEDAALADALRRAGRVVLAETIRRDFVRGADGSVVASADQRVPPLPLFAEAAGASAPFVLPKTPDGVFEFWTRVPTVGDRPSLPLVLATRMGVAGSPQDPSPDEPRRLLNLYGPLGTVTTISYGRALELLADPVAATATFGGKAVLVGYSEANQSRQTDAYRTPFSTADGVDVSGVELAATALGNLLEGSWLRRPGEGAALALLAAQAALLALPWGLARPRAALAATAGVCVVYAGLALWAFSAARLWLPVVLPLAFSPALVGALGIARQHRAALRRRGELERALELGVPRAAIERLAAVLGDGGQGKTVIAVCLCSDIVSYTTIAESLSPQAARDLLNRYLARFIPIVESHGGYAADMVGDSVLSLWIAETGPEPAVAAACRAGLELDRAMNASPGADGALPTRLGLHCGPIFFGEVGAPGRHELRAVGDIVNTASRIQGANKYLNTGVLVSRAVADRLGPGEARSLGRFALAGKGQAMELLQLSREALPAPAAARFGAGLQAFVAGEFGAAAAQFAAAREAGDAGPAVFYLAQCRALAARPRDPAWQGVAVLPGK
ncbi:CHASE2 domain-containing protein [Aromatoleum petrolei]|nr:adenylate/guanylate cyclase domain-containing protein [Aromatoleum petrolei]QTQ34410.1 Putative adenylate/guanylate cyclase [Aromatoleum petrolei]